jgi:hypothetical protein
MAKLPVSPTKSTKAQTAAVKHTRNTIDWQRIHNEYTTAPESISKQQIADAYGINRTTLSLKATKEQWDVQRERFLARVDEQTTEKKSELVASEGASFDTTCLDYSHRILTLVDEELIGSPVFDKDGCPVIVSGKPYLRKRPAKDIATAVRIAQDVGKLALGDKPDNPVKVDLSKASISDLTSALGLVEKLKGQT